jgi:hypothetical protein
VIDALLGLRDFSRSVRRPPQPAVDDGTESGLRLGSDALPGGALERRLAGVVVAALREAFDRDTRRLELEREQVEAERQRAERALRLEMLRQAGEREIGRLRLIAGVAAAGWLGTMLFALRLTGASTFTRASLGVGWVLLLAALAAAFSAQASAGRLLVRAAEMSGPAQDAVSSGPAGALAPWLTVAGLAAIGIGVLMS